MAVAAAPERADVSEPSDSDIELADAADEPQRKPPPSEPWRLSDALGSSPWLRFGLEHRARFEYLSHDYRAAMSGRRTAVSLRTLLPVELTLDALFLGAELQDSRAFVSARTPLTTTLVNAFEPLRLYGGLRFAGLFAAEDVTSLTFGRFVLDVGSRRLLARTEYGNTSNAFTGAELQWLGEDKHTLRAFVTVPVVRLPAARPELERNAIELDRENSGALFWGAFYGSPGLTSGVRLEAYLLVLWEREDTRFPTATRRLFTPGMRLHRSPAPGQLDFQLEAIPQIGSSRASASVTAPSALEHRAFSAHASFGYRLAVQSAVRFVLQYDFASGDAEPNDDRNNRFDALFGDRRFELGPTGIYGAFARSNVSSPGVRFEMAPHPDLDAFTGYRAFWLASATDAWTPAGLADATGASGAFVGHQVEGRIRWNPLPKNLGLELGAAHLIRGTFARTAPGGHSEPSTVIYTQVTGGI